MTKTTNGGTSEMSKFEDVRDKLREPLDPDAITMVDKGYGPIATVNHAIVTDILNRVEPEWTYGITKVIETVGSWQEFTDGGKRKKRFVRDPDGFPHVLAITGWMEVGGVRREEVGEVENPSTYGDELKKAVSDFIKRGAMRFGVGIELWAKGELPETSSPSVGAGDDGAASPALREATGASTPVGERDAGEAATS